MESGPSTITATTTQDPETANAILQATDKAGSDSKAESSIASLNMHPSSHEPGLLHSEPDNNETNQQLRSGKLKVKVIHLTMND